MLCQFLVYSKVTQFYIYILFHIVYHIFLFNLKTLQDSPSLSLSVSVIPRPLPALSWPWTSSGRGPEIQLGVLCLSFATRPRMPVDSQGSPSNKLMPVFLSLHSPRRMRVSLYWWVYDHELGLSSPLTMAPLPCPRAVSQSPIWSPEPKVTTHQMLLSQTDMSLNPDYGRSSHFTSLSLSFLTCEMEIISPITYGAVERIKHNTVCKAFRTVSGSW